MPFSSADSVRAPASNASRNALDRLSVISSHRLEFERALELGEQAVDLARGTGDEKVVGRALDSIKLTVWQLGDLDRLEALAGELEHLWRARDDLWYLQYTLLESAFVPIGRARWEVAAARLVDAAAINRRVQDPLAEALILDALCWLHRSRGAYQESLSAGRRAVAHATELGWGAWPAATLASTLLDLRAPGPAAEVLERGLARGEQLGAANEIVRCLAQLAWAHLLLGAEDEAEALAKRGEQLLAPARGAFVFGAHAYAAIARVLLATGSPERGEALLRPVFEAAERFGWHESAAITGLVRGLCLLARDELDDARTRLAHVARVSDDYGLAAPGWEAHAALAQLGDGGEHVAAAEAIVERMTAALTDDALRDQLRAQVHP
jgi:tetratricopeptide (TPR) repeat protein